jgi:hypothetical protein
VAVVTIAAVVVIVIVVTAAVVGCSKEDWLASTYRNISISSIHINPNNR